MFTLNVCVCAFLWSMPSNANARYEHHHLLPYNPFLKSHANASADVKCEQAFKHRIYVVTSLLYSLFSFTRFLACISCGHFLHVTWPLIRRLGGAMVTRSPLATTAGLRLWATCGMSFTLHSQCLVVFSLEFSSTLRRAQNCSTWNHLIRPTGLGRTCHICLLCRIINRQECIPVGCVPPTSVAISGCVWCTPSCPHTSHPHTPPLSTDPPSLHTPLFTPPLP